MYGFAPEWAPKLAPKWDRHGLITTFNYRGCMAQALLPNGLPSWLPNGSATGLKRHLIIGDAWLKLCSLKTTFNYRGQGLKTTFNYRGYMWLGLCSRIGSQAGSQIRIPKQRHLIIGDACFKLCSRISSQVGSQMRMPSASNDIQF